MEFSLSERYEFLIYTDEKAEYFRLYERFANGKKSFVLAQDNGLGRSMVDIYYTDFNTLFSQLDCNSIESVGSTASFVAKLGGIFLPLWAELTTIERKLEGGLPSAFIEDNEIETLKHSYLDLQRRVKEMIPAIFVDASLKNLLARYFELLKADEHGVYIPLDFGSRGIHFMPVRGDMELPVTVLCSMDPAEIFSFLLYHLFQNNIHLRLCKHCNRYFGFGKKSKQIYCDRFIDGTSKRCMDVGAIRRYDKKLTENPVIKEYKRAYKTRNARIRYGKISRSEFDCWSAQAREQRDQCLAGQISLEEFIAWLDSDKMK